MLPGSDDYNNRKQQSLNTKWDFRLNRNTLLKLNLIYNDAPEPMRRQYNTSAIAGAVNSVPNAFTNATFIAQPTARRFQSTFSA